MFSWIYLPVQRLFNFIPKMIIKVYSKYLSLVLIFRWGVGEFLWSKFTTYSVATYFEVTQIVQLL